ncbi:MAG: hypothetical protein IT436_12750 [Phycisphaerales bacterium]|nr:hypothetical protein [Phycisphaerales bacterium]
MPTDTLAAFFVAVILAVLGLSHLFHPRAWADLFKDLLTRPYAGLIIGTFTLQTGLLVLLAHWTWKSTPGMVVTLIGAAWTCKGTLYLLHPSLVQRIATPHLGHPGRFRIAGAALLALSTVALLDVL